MNATVSLPISELDALRDNLKSSNEKIAKLEATEKQIKILVVKKENYHEWTREYFNARYGAPPLLEREVVVSTTFKNLSEIQDELLEVAKNQVSDFVANLKSTMEANKESYVKEKEEREEKIKEILEVKDKEIARLKKEEVDKTKDERIKELEKQNQELGNKFGTLQDEWCRLINRNWFQRIFNL